MRFHYLLFFYLKFFCSFCQVKADSVQKESSPKNLSVDIAEKPYKAPYARISSLEDPCTKNSEYSKAPLTNLEMATTSVVETAKVLSYDFRNMKLEKIPEVLEKPHGKESSKGIRRLLKFGRKNHSESNVSEADSVSGSGGDDKMNDGTSPSEGTSHIMFSILFNSCPISSYLLVTCSNL